MNDPRNRAKSYIDVTILGESIPWEKEYQKLTFLGFVHAHHHRRHRTRSVNASATGAATAASSEGSPGPQSCLAWMCFTFDTAREKSLQTGTNLRIYNPVVFPLKTAPAAATEPADVSSSGAGTAFLGEEQQKQPEASTVQQQQQQQKASSSAVVEWMVVCTEVCEYYPNCLPKLPDLNTLTVQINIDGK